MVASGIWEVITSPLPGKFCISCKLVLRFVCIECPFQTGHGSRRRSWSRWTPERWHSWNFWCLETETWGFCCFILFVVMRQSFMRKSKERLLEFWNFWFELPISQITTFTPPCVATSFDQNNPDLFTNCILCRRIQDCFAYRLNWAFSFILSPGLSLCARCLRRMISFPVLESKDMRFPNRKVHYMFL